MYAVDYGINVSSKTDTADIVSADTTVKSTTQTISGSHHPL